MLRINLDLYKPATPPSIQSVHLLPDMITLFAHKGKLADVINQVADNTTVYWVSNGEWNMHDMLMALLNINGASEVTISSYALCETAARLFTQLKLNGLITKLHCLIDSRVDVRSATSLQTITAIADTLKLVDTHAKVTVINGAKKYTVIGSANYTENKRYEAGLITSDPSVADFHLTWLNHELHGMV